MVKFLKPGKVVILLNGRQAGKKAVIINNMDDGSKERPYSHAIVAGIEKYPLKVTKDMNKKKLSRRSRVKPFLKVVNVSHLLPTRYGLDIKVSTRLTSETLKAPPRSSVCPRRSRGSSKRGTSPARTSGSSPSSGSKFPHTL
eukprot:TRINITY_DN19_c0_g1_i7.p1 TRINITY_DN19_c0_g1~~TRINITY_DN19_c0_g1_i7.p1  ORF type:complete len:142 (+),score=53.86 TRINITY_DN19_c0_g1_i7:73-498(+)